MADAVSAPARARTATLVVVGPPGRVSEAARVLRDVDQADSIRVVLVSTAAVDLPEAGGGDLIAIEGLKPEHVNNAIAAQRLSSLPTVIWWRGGSDARLAGLSPLADRMVLDSEDATLWARVSPLFERTAMTDIRWPRLTRWRAALAHFFDLAQIRAAADRITALTVTGSDRLLCRLMAGWLDASLDWNGRVAVSIVDAPDGVPLRRVQLDGQGIELRVERLPDGTCADASATLDGQRLASRVVPLGDERLAALLSQELRVRSRDRAFERAVLATIAREG